MSKCIHLGDQLADITICRPGPNGTIQRKFNTNFCAVHKRCLPALRQWAGWEEKPESKIYHRCNFCAEKEIV